eukprot:1157523-Pelagomonas_calceolata.AAC.11
MKCSSLICPDFFIPLPRLLLYLKDASTSIHKSAISALPLHIILGKPRDVLQLLPVCRHQVAAAMNLVLEEANERLKVPLRSLVTWITRPKVRGKRRGSSWTRGGQCAI